jgi:hypothetical protein
MYSVFKSAIFYVLFSIAVIALPFFSTSHLNAASSINHTTEIAAESRGHHGGGHGSSHWGSRGSDRHHDGYYSYGRGYPYYSSYSNDYRGYDDSYPYDNYYDSGPGFGFSIHL